MHGLAPLSFQTDGAQLFPAAAAPVLDELRSALAEVPGGRPGLRLRTLPEFREHLAAAGTIGRVAASVLGAAAQPVRAILFDKNADTNWSLGWHQDRTICVAERHEVEGFGPWTLKDGAHHVEPPFALLASMATLRVHLDDVPADNAPLLIAPGSHRLGRVAQGEIDRMVEACGTHACLAAAGDIWLLATPILHASEPAARPGHRRVLQLDYAARDLPGGLEWLGV